MGASWRLQSPGDLSVELPEVQATPTEPVVAAAAEAAQGWARTPLEERVNCLRAAREGLEKLKDDLPIDMAMETGKPITEAKGEVGAVLAKFELSIADAREHLAARDVADGPHRARVRRLARGVAVVIAPFNFPLHLGHGAAVAHLLAGNPVIFKPSPLAANVAERYARVMRDSLPPGVFGLVQGGADEARGLALDERVRAICFTGSVPAGQALAQALAGNFSKELALELGGRNAAIVCADADLDLAATAVADGLALTCGQRCNATSRLLVETIIADAFLPKLLGSLERYVPGDPLRAETKLGPLISAVAVERYARLTAAPADWILPGRVLGEVGGLRGHYVLPAIRRGFADDVEEPFAPILEVESFGALDAAAARINGGPYGLAASVFTRDAARFHALADELRVGNIYANLPTTFSPSTLPFGGLGLSGNGRPGGRGFVRFCTEEQAVQWTGL